MMPPVVLLPEVADFVLIGTVVLLFVSICKIVQCFFKKNKSSSKYSATAPSDITLPLSYLCMDMKTLSPYCSYLSS